MGNFSRKNHAAQTEARKTDAPKDRATELASKQRNNEKGGKLDA